PGSITLRPTTLIALIRDVVASLAGQGFRRFVFLNGHGGNIATLQAAFAELYADASLEGRASGLRLELLNWFQGKRVTGLSRELFGDAEGRHATPSEIALTWYAYPDQVRDERLKPRRAPLGKIRDAQDYRATFPDGRIGSDPSLASVEHGRRLYEAAVEDALDHWNRALT
ncbi:MAG: creatininase family protein, partial [Gammaproteobacteria bacterium]|nr:creatininase family protein [Gammaproteobacteria bacterium]